MKKFLKALAMGLAYTLLFLGCQFVASVWMTLGVAVKEMLAGNFDIEGFMDAALAGVNAVSAVSGVLTLIIVLLLFRRRGLTRTLALRRPPAGTAVLALAAGIFLNFAISWLMDHLPIPPSLLEGYMESAEGLFSGGPVMEFIAVVLVAPVTEEVVFRGLVLPSFRRAMPAWVAALLTALLFGALHGQLLWIAYAALIGVLLCAVRLKTDSIIPAIALHIGFNFGNYPLEYLAGLGDTAYLAVFIMAVIGALTALIYIFASPRRQRRRTALILLAAGESRRFGGRKLTAEFEGKRLIDRALDAVPEGAFSRLICVTGDSEVAAAAKSRGFKIVKNDAPERGISRSIRLGLGAADADAYLFMVADQPRLTADTVAALVQFHWAAPDKLSAAGFDGVRGNPCVFPEKYVDELWHLSGDAGGSHVIAAHPDSLRVMNVADRGELFDVDTREDIGEVAEETAEVDNEKAD